MTKVKEEVQNDEMEQFLTKKYHDVSQRLQLYTPSGKLSDHYVELVGIDSTKVRKAKKKLYSDIAKNVKEGGFNDEAQEQFTTKLIASAVVGWSFNKECTETNVVYFLENSPAIREAIDVYISNNENYFKKK